MLSKKLGMAGLLALGLSTATGADTAANAAEVTLKAISAFAEKTTFSLPFEKFIDKINAEGKGLVQVNYIGGPKSMPP